MSHPADDLWRTALLAVVVAFCSASQDIVIDAYRIELLDEQQQGAGAAVYVIGYRIAMLVSGAGALFIADYAGWTAAYMTMAGLMLVGVATVLLSPEPGSSVRLQSQPRRSAGDWLREAVIEPFAEFLRRNGLVTAAVILLFIMFYKLGDAMLGVMSNPFYVEMGFSKSEVASVVKSFGLIATLAGGLLGGLVINARGILPALWVCGLTQMLSNLMFAAQAYVGHSVPFLVLTIGLENLAGGMATAAFVAYLSSLCNVHYTATQYALLDLVHGADAHPARLRRRGAGGEHGLDLVLRRHHARRGAGAGSALVALAPHRRPGSGGRRSRLTPPLAARDQIP